MYVGWQSRNFLTDLLQYLAKNMELVEDLFLRLPSTDIHSLGRFIHGGPVPCPFDQIFLESSLEKVIYVYFLCFK